MQAYQHIYLGALYGLLALKSVLLDDFMAIANGQIGPVSISNLTKEELAVFWGGKLLWLSYFVVLPAAHSHHTWSSLALLWMLSEAVAGWILALMFQVTSESPLQCCAMAGLMKLWLDECQTYRYHQEMTRQNLQLKFGHADI